MDKRLLFCVLWTFHLPTVTYAALTNATYICDLNKAFTFSVTRDAGDTSIIFVSLKAVQTDRHNVSTTCKETIGSDGTAYSLTYTYGDCGLDPAGCVADTDCTVDILVSPSFNFVVSETDLTYLYRATCNFNATGFPADDTEQSLVLIESYTLTVIEPTLIDPDPSKLEVEFIDNNEQVYTECSIDGTHPGYYILAKYTTTNYTIGIYMERVAVRHADGSLFMLMDDKCTLAQSSITITEKKGSKPWTPVTVPPVAGVHYIRLSTTFPCFKLADMDNLLFEVTVGFCTSLLDQKCFNAGCIYEQTRRKRSSPSNETQDTTATLTSPTFGTVTTTLRVSDVSTATHVTPSNHSDTSDQYPFYCAIVLICAVVLFLIVTLLAGFLIWRNKKPKRSDKKVNFK